MLGNTALLVDEFNRWYAAASEGSVGEAARLADAIETDLLRAQLHPDLKKCIETCCPGMSAHEVLMGFARVLKRISRKR